MFISREILESVCFVCARFGGQMKPVGSAFFVGFPHKVEGTWLPLLTTALHVIAKAQSESDDGRIFMRLNASGGGFELVEVPDDWWFKPDHSNGIIDVAACVWRPGTQRFDIRIVTQNFGTPEALAADRVGVGADAYFAGLFFNHYGTQRNEPIVRSGTVAAMPTEEVSFRGWKVRAHLVEARSLGGLSGSPVFVDPGVLRDEDGENISFRQNTPMWYLFGLMNGHWEAVAETKDAGNQMDQRYVNMGIAIVTPIEVVLDVALQAAKRDAAQVLRDAPSPNSGPKHGSAYPPVT